MTNVTAIVPARGGSKRVPRKNLEEIDGDPLVGIAACQGTEAETVDRTIVNSEDEEILEVAASYDVEVMERPDRFATDEVPVDPLLKWFVEEQEARSNEIDLLVLLYPTAPLRTVATIDETVRMVRDGPYDSAHTLYEDHSYLWKRDGDTIEPTNYDPHHRGPRQTEDWNQWVENKAVYVMERDLIVETGCRLGDHVGLVEMPAWRSIDIDTQSELEMARFFARNPPAEPGEWVDG